MPTVNMSHELNKDSLLSRLFIHLIAPLSDSNPVVTSLERDKDGNLQIDIRLVINGIEVDAMPWLQRWHQSYDEEVQRAARVLFDEKFRDATDGIHDTLEAARKSIQAKFELPNEEDE
jgi:hypothetical protein